MQTRIKRALMRKPGQNIINGLSMGGHAQKPDFEQALAEHQRYTDLLRELHIEVQVLDADPDFPDGLFVEDPYLVVDRHIIELNPGTPSRRLEYTSLKPFLPKTDHYHIIPKAFRIDGGDILQDEELIFVGLTQRTELKAINALQGFLPQHQVIPIPVTKGLHLKSAMTRIAPRKYIMQPHILTEFERVADAYQITATILTVPVEEAHAANMLHVNEHIIMPEQCHITREKLQRYYPDTHIHELNTTQVRLIDGAITCCSLLFCW